MRLARPSSEAAGVSSGADRALALRVNFFSTMVDKPKDWDAGRCGPASPFALPIPFSRSEAVAQESGRRLVRRQGLEPCSSLASHKVGAEPLVQPPGEPFAPVAHHGAARGVGVLSGLHRTECVWRALLGDEYVATTNRRTIALTHETASTRGSRSSGGTEK